MAELVRVRLDETEHTVPAGTTVAALVAGINGGAVRRSLAGEPRGLLCGMGICFECRATVDGRPHVRTCMIPVREGMEVRRDG